MRYERHLANGYLINDDRDRLDLDLIYWFLAEESYWSRGMTREQVGRAASASVCFGLYGPDGGQCGFARVVTDLTTFAWLTYVFVIAGQRGKGLGRALVQAVLDHPDLQGLRRWLLATRDAQDFYAGLGFTSLDSPVIFMTRRHPG